MPPPRPLRLASHYAYLCVAPLGHNSRRTREFSSDTLRPLQHENHRVWQERGRSIKTQQILRLHVVLQTLGLCRCQHVATETAVPYSVLNENYDPV